MMITEDTLNQNHSKKENAYLNKKDKIYKKEC